MISCSKGGECARHFPFSSPLDPSCLQLNCSCLPLPGMNSCSRMLHVTAVKLQRADFIKHILLLDFHLCSIILSFQHKRHFLLYTYWAPDECKYTPCISGHLLLIVFKPGPAVDYILPSTASSSVNFCPKASVAVGLVQSLYSFLRLHMPYLALVKIWTGDLTVRWSNAVAHYCSQFPAIQSRQKTWRSRTQMWRA